MTRERSALLLLPLLLAACESTTPTPTPDPIPVDVAPVASAAPVDPDAPGLPLLMRRNVPFVKVRVGDLEPRWFVLDTGAALNAISEELAEELGDDLEWIERELKVTDPNNRETVLQRHAFLPEITLGEFTYERVPVSAVNLKEASRAIGFPVGGVLGVPFFAPRPVTVDYPNRRLVLDAAPLAEGDDVVPLRFHPQGRVPLVPVQLAGAVVGAMLDTGSAQALGLPTPVLERLQLQQDPVVVGHNAQIGGVAESKACRLSGDVKLGPHTFATPVADVDEQWPRIGGEMLYPFAVTVDLRGGLARFAREARDPISAPSVRSHGVGFLTDARGCVVGYVLDNVPSAADVKVGDRVVSVGGKPLSSLRPTWQAEVGVGPLRLELEREGERYTVELPSVVLVP